MKPYRFAEKVLSALDAFFTRSFIKDIENQNSYAIVIFSVPSEEIDSTEIVPPNFSS